MLGDTYFCVGEPRAGRRSTDAGTAHPEVGDRDDMDGYMLSVTPKIAMGVPQDRIDAIPFSS